MSVLPPQNTEVIENQLVAATPTRSQIVEPSEIPGLDAAIETPQSLLPHPVKSVDGVEEKENDEGLTDKVVCLKTVYAKVTAADITKGIIVDTEDEVSDHESADGDNVTAGNTNVKKGKRKRRRKNGKNRAAAKPRAAVLPSPRPSQG